MKTTVIISVILLIAAIGGEIRCIYKVFKCNWEPIGKAEILYTASACSGFGAIVGWFDIKDN